MIDSITLITQKIVLNQPAALVNKLHTLPGIS